MVDKKIEKLVKTSCTFCFKTYLTILLVICGAIFTSRLIAFSFKCPRNILMHTVFYKQAHVSFSVKFVRHTCMLVGYCVFVIRVSSMNSANHN